MTAFENTFQRFGTLKCLHAVWCFLFTTYGTCKISLCLIIAIAYMYHGVMYTLRPNRLLYWTTNLLWYTKQNVRCLPLNGTFTLKHFNSVIWYKNVCKNIVLVKHVDSSTHQYSTDIDVGNSSRYYECSIEEMLPVMCLMNNWWWCVCFYQLAETSN